MPSEETERILQQSRDTMVGILASYYPTTDMSKIARKIVDGELIEAYIATLNMEADLLGRGGSYNSTEHKEIKSMIQACEHWIAKRVLSMSGWEEKQVTRYFKKEG